MDIYKHKETLLKWICSCQTAQQLDLFEKLVVEFDETRFNGQTEPIEIELVRKELFDAIIEQRVALAGKDRHMRVTGHCLLIPDESAVLLSQLN